MEKWMRSKIEKLKLPKNPKGNFCLGYQDEDGVTLQMWELAEKVNQIIDHLNSQAQPEEYAERIRIKGEIRDLNKLATQKVKEVGSARLVKDTPEEWVCPKCDFDDCYPYKNSEDFGLMYCPACSELVKLNNKKK